MIALRFQIKIFNTVFVSSFYCCLTNYDTFSSLKQTPFINTQFCRSKLGHNLVGFLAQFLTRLKSVFWPDYIHTWNSRPPQLM